MDVDVDLHHEPRDRAPADDAERRRLVELMVAAGLDQTGAYKLAKTVPAEVIERQLAWWPERRRTSTIRRPQSYLYASIAGDWALTKPGAGDAGRTTTPPTESVVLAALEPKEVTTAPCPSCGTEGERIGRLVSCAPCGMSYPIDWRPPSDPVPFVEYGADGFVPVDAVG